jgi:predicted amidohydrolase YtcJ
LTAFEAHTRGGWRACRRDQEGALVAGAPATFAVWTSDDLLSDLTEPDPVCALTVRAGKRIYTHPG